MSSNPINLGLRFLLELAALFSVGYWGWNQHGGVLRLVLTVGLPLLFAALWGTFRVPGDPGDAPVAIPGPARLLLELILLGLGVWALYASGQPIAALSFAVLLILHYATSYDRVVWLVRQRVER
jgi:hypothetical protein